MARRGSPGTPRRRWRRRSVELGPERVAAFFCEPIIGAGGVYLPPDGYLQAVREICRRHEVLFVADEVICGYGRVGDWFACGRLGLDPDAVTFAKGITSGYVPLGGVIVGRTIQEPFWSGAAAGVWRHGYTYSGHASAAAAAHANLDIIEREGLVARGLALETEIPDALAPLARPRARERDPRRASAPSPPSRSILHCSPTIRASQTASR